MDNPSHPRLSLHVGHRRSTSLQQQMRKGERVLEEACMCLAETENSGQWSIRASACVPMAVQKRFSCEVARSKTWTAILLVRGDMQVLDASVDRPMDE